MDARTPLVLGDDVSTDDIIPAARCTSADPAHLGRYALEHVVGEKGLRGRWTSIEAGRNFGCGSSREHAPAALVAAGIRLVRADSFAEIFFRNSINVGLALELRGGEARAATVDDIVSAGGLLPYLRSGVRRSGREAHRPRVADESTPPRVAGASTPPRTMAEKILARAAGLNDVRPGDVIFVRADLAMSHDAVAGPAARRFREGFGADARLLDPSRVVLVADHFLQVPLVRDDPRPAILYQEMKDFAAEQGCVFFDKVSEYEAAGICHVLLPEKGCVRPGTVIAGTDSHTCTQGAFGAFAVGVGTTDMAGIFATGEFWLRVPATVRVELSGELPHGAAAKDVVLELLSRIGCDGAAGAVLEFHGDGLAGLSIDERMTLANMSVECGAMTALLGVDDVTTRWLASRGVSSVSLAEESDAGANFARTMRLDLAAIRPRVAGPGKPDRVCDLADAGRVSITTAFIGSCTGGKLDDLAAAAAMLRGRRVAPGVRLLVVPASQEVLAVARERGLLADLEGAGAVILPSGCGACINAGPGIVADGETAVFATSRNFPGRSGHPNASVWLASPRTVAASAIAGFLTDKVEELP